MYRLNRDGPNKKTNLTVWLMMLAGCLFVSSAAVAAGVPNDVCAGCHDEIVEAFSQAPHGVYFSKNSRLADNSCESCHGSAAAHVEDGDPALIINPANHDQSGGKELCLTCHTGHQFGEWSFTAHSAAGVTCADCHTIHGTFAQSIKKKTPELCYDCHSDVRSASYMPSHHPIAEGKVSCEDCHALHGSQGTAALDDPERELCFTCHAEKEGPFVFEHAPVNENCMVCHTPHGSIADNLLKESEPALCLNCHPMHFHATVEGVDGDFTVPLDPSRNGTSTPDGWKKGFLTKCTQCHTEVHGSDLPSQTISGQGSALTR